MAFNLIDILLFVLVLLSVLNGLRRGFRKCDGESFAGELAQTFIKRQGEQ